MEKLTSILGVVDTAPGGRIVLDKAMRIARDVHARVRLLVLHPRLPRGLAELCKSWPDVDIVLCGGDGATETSSEAILRTASTGSADLVIKSAAGSSLRRTSLTAGDWSLAHECPVPLLLARPRPWRTPPRFAAAVDIAADGRLALSRTILHTAGFLALECEAELDVLYSEPEQDDATLRMERAVRLARMVREFRVGCERIRHLSGNPEATLPALLQEQDYDCVILGSVRSHGLQSFKEGVTSRLFDATSGDVLFVKPADRLETREPARPRVVMPARAT